MWLGSRETVPYTHRTHAIFTTPAMDAQLGEQTFAQVLASARAAGTLLPPYHPAVKVGWLAKGWRVWGEPSQESPRPCPPPPSYPPSSFSFSFQVCGAGGPPHRRRGVRRRGRGQLGVHEGHGLGVCRHRRPHPGQRVCRAGGQGGGVHRAAAHPAVGAGAGGRAGPRSGPRAGPSCGEWTVHTKKGWQGEKGAAGGAGSRWRACRAARPAHTSLQPPLCRPSASPGCRRPACCRWCSTGPWASPSPRAPLSWLSSCPTPAKPRRRRISSACAWLPGPATTRGPPWRFLPSWARRKRRRAGRTCRWVGGVARWRGRPRGARPLAHHPPPLPCHPWPPL